MGRLIDEDDVVDWLLTITEMYDGTGHFVDENVVKKNIESQIAKIPSAQPTQTDTSNTLKALDCVERRAAVDALMDEFKRTPTMAIRAKHVIEQLPSTQLIAFASPDNWDEKPKFYPEDWKEIL